MSETGIISQEYQDTAELFRDINRSVMLLKKHHFQLSGAKQISDQDLLEARQLIASVLRQLVAKLNKEVSFATEEKMSSRVPPFFLKRLRERHRGELQWYVEDLQELRLAIEDAQPLTDELIAHLDELCGQLDAETTSIYRKLWRK